MFICVFVRKSILVYGFMYVSVNMRVCYVFCQPAPSWAGFGESKLRFILCSLCLVNTSRDGFHVLAGLGWVWPTHVEMDFVSSLTW